jgi:cytochrome c-type biogenesis protein
MDSAPFSFGVAFLAGLVSFLSPCILPLVPIYLAQLVGHSIWASPEGHQPRPARFVTFLHAVMFVLGFTLAFVALGASASALGSVLRAHQFLLRQIGGILLILIGLHLAGILKIPVLYWQKRLVFRPSRPGYLASLVIGVIFAIGWTPCISLLLGSILGMAATAGTLRQGVLLLLAYALGLGIPFLLLGLGLDQVSPILKWLRPHLGKIEVGTGVVMIVMGVLISFNLLVFLNRFVPAGFGLRRRERIWTLKHKQRPAEQRRNGRPGRKGQDAADGEDAAASRSWSW